MDVWGILRPLAWLHSGVYQDGSRRLLTLSFDVLGYEWHMAVPGMQRALHSFRVLCYRHSQRQQHR